jgi:flagellar biosynthesis/type III secretory pathway M-ring protein FliF/YscJ
LSGAQAGLLPANIKVVIDGTPMKSGDPSSESGMDGSFVDSTRENEDYYCETVTRALDYIRGLKVSVHVKLNTASQETTIHDVNPKQTVNVPVSEKEATSDSHGGGDPALEAGAASNVGVSVSSGGGGGGAVTTSDIQNEYKSDYSKTDQTVRKGPGDSTPESASVSVPRSYLIAEFKSRNNKREPEEAELQTFATARFADIKQQVKSCTGIATDDKVTIGDYSDDLELQSSSVNDTENPAVSPVTLALTSHTKEIGVGLLAAVSLFMVSMIVRKSVPAVALADAGETADQLSMSTEALAMAKGDANAMDGVELDEASVKAQQVVEQVQQMVQTNPDGAATLVKRWLNR